ncbi:MAG: ABC transporter permease [Thermoanaerobaculales bacterium]|jgi:putative ABC transport system permease protein|nr:ABC transporter permease [Thermoanaerobaculales bacterium]
MDLIELIRFVVAALGGHRLRSFLSALGVGIGVTAVILLTSLGEGTRDYIVTQSTQFGTTLIGINPGKVKTVGMPGVLGGTTHKLTIDDAEALRRIPEVDEVVPVAFGQAEVEGGGRGRAVFIYGVGWEAAAAWRFNVSQGSFLPRMDPNRRGSFAVLGAKLARELFGDGSPLGRRVRIGGASFLVTGVMEPKGQLLGFDLDDTAFIPVASAMDLFNIDELHEIDVVAASSEAIEPVAEGIRRLLMERHRGEEDFTITTQTEMLDTFGRVISMITIAVSGIAGISLFVGAMGILTIMWISVHERTGEIGLLRAIGVPRRMVQLIFLLEAVVLAFAGGVIGLAAGFSVTAVLRATVPGMPMSTPVEAVAAALVMSLVVGVVSGVAPARRAARLDPIEALRAE